MIVRWKDSSVGYVSAGGLLVPVETFKDTFFISNVPLAAIKTGGNNMRTLELNRVIVNADQIVSVDYQLDKRTAELTAGDIYTVVVQIRLSNGDNISVQTEDELRKVAVLISDERIHITSSEGLPYYIHKMLEYNKCAKTNIIPMP